MRNKYLVYCKHCDLVNPPKEHYIGVKRPKCRLNEQNRNRKHRQTDKGKEQVRLRVKKYRDTEKGRSTTQKYRENNRDYNREYSRKHFQENRGKYYARTRKYQASKLNATPSWLSEAQIKEMEDIYTRAVELSQETGILHHVDHVHPLQGINSCGLHVPWNLQILTAKENLSKSNKQGFK